ncbi:MAG: ATP-binding cassette domain-containing protein, partial [Alphaproteobacteria bacterium]|nr:ATP-binding cassette domain-containing protein [Alphaproteobacteria bacterium]
MSGAMAPTPLLALEGITKTFRGSGGAAVQAAKSIDLTVGYGETVALVGESGSGKSTLARIALCLVKPDSGRVRLEGKCLTGIGAGELRRLRTK